MYLVLIFPDFIHAVWPSVAPMLERALAYGDGKFNVDQLKLMVIRNEQSLLVAYNEQERVIGAATVAFQSYPNARTAFVTAIGGKLITNEKLNAQLEDFCVRQGATEIEGWARESVARLWRQKFGYEQPCVIVRKKL